VRRNNRKTWDKRKQRKGRRPEKNPHVANEPTPRVVSPSGEVKRLLEGIGTPRPAPFKPDPFQTEALELLEFEDVLVTAPTGSGKTWIAREEIRRLIENGRQFCEVLYAAIYPPQTYSPSLSLTSRPVESTFQAQY